MICLAPATGEFDEMMPEEPRIAGVEFHDPASRLENETRLGLLNGRW